MFLTPTTLGSVEALVSKGETLLPWDTAGVPLIVNYSTLVLQVPCAYKSAGKKE
jgi:hypothetical protein